MTQKITSVKLHSRNHSSTKGKYHAEKNISSNTNPNEENEFNLENAPESFSFKPNLLSEDDLHPNNLSHLGILDGPLSLSERMINQWDMRVDDENQYDGHHDQREGLEMHVTTSGHNFWNKPISKKNSENIQNVTNNGNTPN